MGDMGREASGRGFLHLSNFWMVLAVGSRVPGFQEGVAPGLQQLCQAHPLWGLGNDPPTPRSSSTIAVFFKDANDPSLENSTTLGDVGNFVYAVNRFLGTK